MKKTKKYKIGTFWAVIIIFWFYMISFSTIITLVDLIPTLTGKILGVKSSFILSLLLFLFIILFGCFPIILIKFLKYIE